MFSFYQNKKHLKQKLKQTNQQNKTTTNQQDKKLSKQNKTTAKNTQKALVSVLCWADAPKHGACPKSGWYNPVSHRWRKLVFPFPAGTIGK